MIDQEQDPYVLYFVVRRKLKLSEGKVGAQCSHAMHYLAREAYPEKMRAVTGEEYERHVAFREWDRSPTHRKVVLGANDTEFMQVQLENDHFFMVTDLGFTEVDPNTQTCMCLWPMRKSARSPILQKLRPL